MNQQPLTSAPSLRFRRWSRKAYAPFASVGRHVTIGCVHKGIADRSLVKQMGTGIKAGCTEDGQVLWSLCGSNPDDAPPDLCMTDIQELNMNEIRSLVRVDAYRKYFSAWTTYAHPSVPGRHPSEIFSGGACLFHALSPNRPMPNF